MVSSRAIIDIQQKYDTGQKQFQKIQLRGADLRGLNLRGADFRGADLSGANLREVNLSGANLTEVYLNEADLTSANLESANLTGASLIKAYLMKTNLQSANLSQAYLTGAYLTKSNLINADITGAYLNGSKLTGADFTGARYDRTTHFDSHCDPLKMGMRKDHSPQVAEVIVTLPGSELLDSLNHLSQISAHYLGNTMTVRYWESARPNLEALKDFTLDRSARFSWSGSPKTSLNTAQIQLAREWIDRFARACSSIIQDFPQMIDPKQVASPLFRPIPDVKPLTLKPSSPEEVRVRVSTGVN